MKGSNIHKIITAFTREKVSGLLKWEFRHWLVSSNDEVEKTDALYEVWEETSSKPEAGLARSYEVVRIKAGLKLPPKKHTSMEVWKLMRAASVIVIPLIAIVTSWLYVDHRLSASEMLECAVPMGEHRELLLPDGTKAIINSGSMLVYPKTFYGDTRTVFLSGEANFEVHKDAKHPFIVKTSQIAVKALGTKFNINAYADGGKSTTILENGSIQISDILEPKQTIILKPNEQLEVDHYTRRFKKTTVNAKLNTEWIHGHLNFINQSLKEIINVLQRHYNVTISIDPRLGVSDLYTIKLKKNESLAKVMDILKIAIEGSEVRFINKNVIEFVTSDSIRKKGGSKRK